MKALLFVALMATTVANAETLIVTDSTGNSLRLYETTCSDPTVLGYIAARGVGGLLMAQFKNGDLHYAGKDLKACWLAWKDGNVHVMDSSGETLVIPQDMFKRMSDV